MSPLKISELLNPKLHAQGTVYLYPALRNTNLRLLLPSLFISLSSTYLKFVLIQTSSGFSISLMVLSDAVIEVHILNILAAWLYIPIRRAIFDLLKFQVTELFMLFLDILKLNLWLIQSILERFDIRLCNWSYIMHKRILR